jgi:hypothetical protein
VNENSSWFGSLSFSLAIPALFLLMCSLWYFTRTPSHTVIPLPMATAPTDPAAQMQIVSGIIMTAAGQPLNSPTLPQDSRPLRCMGIVQIKISRGIYLTLDSAEFSLAPQELRLESGKAEISVPRKGTAFSVVVPTAVLGVRGTAFSVWVLPDTSTKVGVTEGEVSVISITGEQCSLFAGKGATILADGTVKTEDISLPPPRATPALPGTPAPPKDSGASAEALLHD